MLGSDHNQIANSPTNTSTSKAQYSFPKSKRFPDLPSSTGKFYDIPVSLSKRSTTFGYGNKSDFTSGKEKTPDPGTYKITTDISKGQAFSFGISRDQCKSYIEGHFKADPSVPGPGTYNFSPKFSREGIKISIGAKWSQKKITESVPGPGAYEQSWGKTPGHYVISTAKNLETHMFSPKSSARFPKTDTDKVPGPWTYNVDKGFLKNSKILSTCKSSGSIIIGATERKDGLPVKNTPGPGSYRLPSDFGYYDTPRANSKAMTSDKNSKRK